MMSTEQSTFSKIRELYARISSTAPKERLYRRLKPSEVFDLFGMLELGENPEAATPGDASHIKEEAG